MENFRSKSRVVWILYLRSEVIKVFNGLSSRYLFSFGSLGIGMSLNFLIFVVGGGYCFLIRLLKRYFVLINEEVGCWIVFKMKVNESLLYEVGMYFYKFNGFFKNVEYFSIYS